MSKENSTKQPFKRINSMLHIVMASSATMTEYQRKAFLATYKSRGHSKAGATHSPSHKHMSIKRASKAKHNVAKRRAK